MVSIVGWWDNEYTIVLYILFAIAVTYGFDRIWYTFCTFFWFFHRFLFNYSDDMAAVDNDRLAIAIQQMEDGNPKNSWT